MCWQNSWKSIIKTRQRQYKAHTIKSRKTKKQTTEKKLIKTCGKALSWNNEPKTNEKTDESGIAAKEGISASEKLVYDNIIQQHQRSGSILCCL